MKKVSIEKSYPYIKMYVRKFLETGSVQALKEELKLMRQGKQ